MKQRVFTGTVTKLHDENFGFVDDEVLFQPASVKGFTPQVGIDEQLEWSVFGGSRRVMGLLISCQYGRGQSGAALLDKSHQIGPECLFFTIPFQLNINWRPKGGSVKENPQ